jgi:hypothetical protein
VHGTPNLPSYFLTILTRVHNLPSHPITPSQTYQEQSPLRLEESSTKLYHGGTTLYRTRHGAAEFNLNLRAMGEHDVADCYPKVP